MNSLRTNRPLSILLVLILSISMIACTTSTIVTDIQIVVDAMSAAAPIIAAFSGPGAMLVTTYLTAVTEGLNCALAAAQAPGATSATIETAMVTCLATAIAPTLPAGTPQEIVAIIKAIAAEVANLIQKYGHAKLTVEQAAVPVHLSYTDHQKIKAMRSKLDAALVKLTTRK